MASSVEESLEELRAELRAMREDLVRQTTPPRFLSLSEAALVLGIHSKTLGRMIKVGAISVKRFLPGGDPHIPVREIERLEQEAAPEAAPVRRSGGRPKAQRHDPRAEVAKLRERRAARAKP